MRRETGNTCREIIYIYNARTVYVSMHNVHRCGTGDGRMDGEWESDANGSGHPRGGCCCG